MPTRTRLAITLGRRVRSPPAREDNQDHHRPGVDAARHVHAVSEPGAVDEPIAPAALERLQAQGEPDDSGGQRHGHHDQVERAAGLAVKEHVLAVDQKCGRR